MPSYDDVRLKLVNEVDNDRLFEVQVRRNRDWEAVQEVWITSSPSEVDQLVERIKELEDVVESLQKLVRLYESRQVRFKLPFENARPYSPPSAYPLIFNQPRTDVYPERLPRIT